ncbi:hypothetical protein CROQUDRAFT_673687 [Cronartium quercuum f. sp. fusiforme G11]|uniref:Uncharacterized protein n=1 Tax=Cronartium quercuum f. sp. fusiforme G11 TaxID=708437 RepID=A0A9P6N936_9BASI|nr:hypothetical protein CROQUDRAFT_673687 [Cronartium quercuum f. sp. fusiforme G11]
MTDNSASPLNPQPTRHRTSPAPLNPAPQHPSNASSSSPSPSPESDEDLDLKIAILASREEHERHLISLELREAEMLERARQESEKDETDRKASKQARLANLKKSVLGSQDDVVRESYCHHHQLDLINDEDDLALKIALAMSLNEVKAADLAQLPRASSSAPTLDHRRLPSLSPADLELTQSGHTLPTSLLTLRPAFKVSIDEPNHQPHQPPLASDQYQKPCLESSFLVPRRPSFESQCLGSLGPSHHLASFSGIPADQTPEVTVDDFNRPASSLGLSRPDRSRLDNLTHDQETGRFGDRYAALAPFEGQSSQSVFDRLPLMIRTRWDQFVPFPDEEEHHPFKPSHSNYTMANTARVPENADEVSEEVQGAIEGVDESMEKALERARRLSVYSGSFTTTPTACEDGSERSDVFVAFSSHLPMSGSRKFVANTRPSDSGSEGARYGLLKSIHDRLDFHGQLPDAIRLSKFGADSKGLFGIEAQSWSQLLIYLMRNGNSHIKADLMDIAEAQENNTPIKLALSVEFAYWPTIPNPETSVRLIIELVSGPESTFVRSAQKPTPVRSARLAVTSQSSSTTPNWDVREFIEFPKPYLELPISLATLATTLREIHRVAWMANGASSSFKVSKHGHNTEYLERLAKAIEHDQMGQRSAGIV